MKKVIAIGEALIDFIPHEKGRALNNVENFLRECLDSVLKQTLKEIEVICVDDGSTNHSLNILREYEKKDTRVKVISKPNAGYGNTMNVGTDAATGE